MPRARLYEVAVVLFTISFASCGQVQMSPLATRQSQSLNSAFFQVVDAFDDGFSYAYAPSIILKNGAYHVFFCSEGGGNYPSWDAIRYTTSTDGQTWSKPKIMLQATAANGQDMAACDPSLVLYQGYYYLYYSSAVTTASKTYQTVIQIARSASLDGPYLTYTRRGTWEKTPTDPKVIIYPLQTHSTHPSGYGAGQTSVVVRDGELLMWCTDDSVFAAGQPQVKTYMLQSADPVVWTPNMGQATNLVNQASIDVKFDSSQSQFVMIRVENEFSPTSYLARAYSSDGMTWTTPQGVYPSGQFPQYGHDAGIAGDETGILASPSALVGFGVPYGLADVDNWGHWDLYGGYIDAP